jgi:hypothetical protein
MFLLFANYIKDTVYILNNLVYCFFFKRRECIKAKHYYYDFRVHDYLLKKGFL